MAMRIAVVSDTHGHIPNTINAVRVLEELDASLVIHCGDIGSPRVVSLFSNWPTHFVFGNVDSDRAELRDAIRQSGNTCHEEFGSLELEGLRIAFLHSDDSRRFQETIRSGQWDLVCYGHTHKAEHHHQGQTLVLNPGAIHRATPHSFALIELPRLAVTQVVV